MTKKVKSVVLVNPRDGERFVCDDYDTVHKVDGVDFIFVRPENAPARINLMRKDSLQKTKQ